MAIQKRPLHHFVNFFASKFNFNGQRSLLPPTSSAWNGKNFQASLCLTLAFLSEGVVYNLQNCLVCIHDYLHFSCLETTTELKRKPLDYFNYLHELIIMKKKLMNLSVSAVSNQNLTIMSQVQNRILNFSWRWRLINCSETLSRAVDFEIWLLYECQQHVTSLIIYGSLLWERTDIYPVLHYETMKRFCPDDNWGAFPLLVRFFFMLSAYKHLIVICTCEVKYY